MSHLEDAAAIQALVSGYARTLSGCRAEEYADLFAPGTGYFASGIRGQVAGRDRLIALVQSERQCTSRRLGGLARQRRVQAAAAAGRPSSLGVTPAGVRGTADLGGAGQYQDEHVKTPAGWRFKSRTVIIPRGKGAGLDANEMLAIRRPAGADAVDYYVADQNGVRRLRTSGVEIRVVNMAVSGRVYLRDGGYYDDVYRRRDPASGGSRRASRWRNDEARLFGFRSSRPLVAATCAVVSAQAPAAPGGQPPGPGGAAAAEHSRLW